MEPAINDAKSVPFVSHTQMCIKEMYRFVHDGLLKYTDRKKREWRNGDFKWPVGCLKVWLWEFLEISRAAGAGVGEGAGAAGCPFLSRQNFMLLSFLDTSQVCWAWNGHARPLCHLAVNIWGLCQPFGEVLSFVTAGLALSAGWWGGRGPF